MYDDACLWCEWFDDIYGCCLPSGQPCPAEDDEDLW